MLTRLSAVRSALVLGGSLLATSALGQAPSGGDFLVTTYTSGYQLQARSAMAADGRFVVVWVDRGGRDGSEDGVFGQLFDATGHASGADFQVNTYTTGWQGAPVVGMAPSGDFVVAWTDGLTDRMFAKRYDRAGRALGGELQLNSTITFNQQLTAAAMAPSGRFVVAWHGGLLGHSGVYARLFDAGGQAAGPEFLVSLVTQGFQGVPDVAMDGAGDFVVVWYRGGIYGQRLAASGQPKGGEFRVDTAAGEKRFPSVAMAPTGEFVVAWNSFFQDHSNYAVAARRFDASGSPLGSDFVVNTFTTGYQYASSSAVAVDASGGFVVQWASEDQDGSGFGIVGQRFDAAGARLGGEFQVNADTTGSQFLSTIAGDGSGNFVATWNASVNNQDVFGRRFGGLLAAALRVDTVVGNGVLEPGESVDVRPAWRNSTGSGQAFTGTLSRITGPPGATYGITDPTGGYGVVPDGGVQSCTDCYGVIVSSAPVRPALHWDVSVLEGLAPDVQGQQKSWSLHVGRSFDDVPPSSPFYRSVEILLHQQMTAGCGGSSFCPTSSTTRAQMAPLLLSAAQGPAFLPAPCTTPVFNDVPASSGFCRWIEELARRGVSAGCGGGNYCPNDPVTRAQMAVFVLATKEPGLTPPACTPGSEMFADVPAASAFCRWIEELARRGVTGGCGGGNYCPAQPVTREQMAVFLTGTFGLTLYGP